MAEELNKVLAAVMWLSLEHFNNQELAAFNIAVQLYGKVPPENISYQTALDMVLIKEDGTPHSLPELKVAASAEVNRRVKEGTFN